MVRLTATLAAVIGIGTVLFFLHVVGKAPWETLEARHLREMKDREETPDRAEPMNLAAIFALPAHLSVAEYSGYERRAVSVECRIRNMLRASDGDIHLECVAPESSDPRDVMAEITPAWRGHPAKSGIDSPGWGFEQLAAAFRPRFGTTDGWPGRPTRVRLTGWLLFDHGGDVLERLLGIPRRTRATDWEIHPVTRIERWDDARASWIEVRR